MNTKGMVDEWQEMHQVLMDAASHIYEAARLLKLNF